VLLLLLLLLLLAEAGRDERLTSGSPRMVDPRAVAEKVKRKSTAKVTIV
jgi:hypothetical protein